MNDWDSAENYKTARKFMTAQKITEEMGIHKQWKLEADKVMTPVELQAFVKHLTEDYEHDYGTIVHAIESAMLAAYSVVNKSPQGGITGFQASCIGWAMISRFMSVGTGPLKLVQYEHLLYPQYESRFKCISSDTWKWVQDEAKKKLAEKNGNVHPDVHAHWQKVANGEVPFGLTVRED